MAKYSILTYNFGNYEILKDPIEMDPDCEYICVTDQTVFHSETKWTIRVATNIPGNTPFDKVLYVRYHPFEFVHTDTVLLIDSSIHIIKSLSFLFNDFNASAKTLGICVHPERSTFPTEYQTWINYRAYPIESAIENLERMRSTAYDLSFNGLYQVGFMLVKNNSMVMDFFKTVYNECKRNDTMERIDQIIFSYVLNSRFPDIDCFCFNETTFRNDISVAMCLHGQTQHLPFWQRPKQGYYRNKLIDLYEKY